MNELKLLFIINTPGQAYTWRHCIEYFLKEDFKVGILARDKGPTLGIIDSFGFNYSAFRPIQSKLFRSLDILNHVIKGFEFGKKLHPSIVIGFGLDTAMLAKILHAKSVIFSDSEAVPVQHYLTKLIANIIITPSSFQKSLGKMHLRVNSVKELAYLHPKYFVPDPSIYEELGINRNEKYIIIRFNSFNAVHDIGNRGFSDDNKNELVNKLEKYARVFISAEGHLAPNLERYKLPIAPFRIHHALYYADMMVCDTGTMAWEAAVLGTIAVAGGAFTQKFGNFIELEQKYGLAYSFIDPQKAVNKALELIQDPELKQHGSEKRQLLLADKVDFTKFIIDYIENTNEVK